MSDRKYARLFEDAVFSPLSAMRFIGTKTIPNNRNVILRFLFGSLKLVSCGVLGLIQVALGVVSLPIFIAIAVFVLPLQAARKDWSDRL